MYAGFSPEYWMQVIETKNHVGLFPPRSWNWNFSRRVGIRLWVALKILQNHYFLKTRLLYSQVKLHNLCGRYSENSLQSKKNSHSSLKHSCPLQILHCATWSSFKWISSEQFYGNTSMKSCKNTQNSNHISQYFLYL